MAALPSTPWPGAILRLFIRSNELEAQLARVSRRVAALEGEAKPAEAKNGAAGIVWWIERNAWYRRKCRRLEYAITECVNFGCAWHLKSFEERYPGMQHINLSPPLTTPKDKMVEQYRMVGPHFRSRAAVQAAAE
jgi:hypothetical protein